MGFAGLLLILAIYVPRYYVGMGVNFGVVAFAIGVVRLLDVFLDPLLALIMDRTRTPIGRYRPWLLAGTPIVMVGVYHLLVAHGTVEEVERARQLLHQFGAKTTKVHIGNVAVVA